MLRGISIDTIIYNLYIERLFFNIALFGARETILRLRNLPSMQRTQELNKNPVDILGITYGLLNTAQSNP